MKRKLTALSLQALRPEARAFYVGDATQPGLRVRVAPTGTMTWSVVYRIKGASGVKTASLGVCDPAGRSGLSLTEARERAGAIVKAARQGVDLIASEAEAKDRDARRLTINDLAARYGQAIRNNARPGGPLRTANATELRLSRALALWRDRAADDLTRADVGALLDTVAATRPREADQRRHAIRGMFAWGIARGLVSHNPVQGLPAYGGSAPKDRTLSVEEIRLVWEWLDAGADRMPADVIAALRVQFCLGARVGEVGGMECSEFRREGEALVWTLPASRSKNKRERRTPIVGRARLLIEAAIAARKGKGALFRTTDGGRALRADDIANALANRPLPCAKFTTHDIRRTVVTQLDELGIALDTIAAVVGHMRGTRDTQTLVRHYSRARLDDRVTAALSSWDQRLGEVITDTPKAKANVIDIRNAR